MHRHFGLTPALAFFKAVNVEVVYQDFGEDGSE